MSVCTVCNATCYGYVACTCYTWMGPKTCNCDGCYGYVACSTCDNTCYYHYHATILVSWIGWEA